MEFLGIDIRGFLFLLGFGSVVFIALVVALLVVFRNIATVVNAHADELIARERGVESHPTGESKATTVRPSPSLSGEPNEMKLNQYPVQAGFE